MPFIAVALPYIAAGAAAAGAYVSYSASQQQAKQSRMNASAQAQAIGMEQQRQALETNQAQQRKIMEQRRFNASQVNALSEGGFLSTTGSPLDILADTHTAQRREITDMGYQNDTTQWQLGAKAQSAISEGNSQARATMGQAGGTLLSNLGSIAHQGSKMNFGSSGDKYSTTIKS